MEQIDETEETINQSIFSQREAANQEPEDKVFTETTGCVTGCELLNIRQDPNPDADILSRIGKNTKVTIKKAVGEWYNIATPSVSGWCMSRYITTD